MTNKRDIKVKETSRRKRSRKIIMKNFQQNQNKVLETEDLYDLLHDQVDVCLPFKQKMHISEVISR